MIDRRAVQPDGGEVWIDGRLATYAPPHKRDIGMVFQNYALFPHLTVAENIAFPLRMRRRARGRRSGRRCARVLELVRLPDVGGRLPRALSGGQQQRIALARCIVYKPSIVLMDEPLGALDKKLRDQMQLEIKRLHTELGITVLYVTHDQEEAMIMSDRICLMNDGAHRADRHAGRSLLPAAHACSRPTSSASPTSSPARSSASTASRCVVTPRRGVEAAGAARTQRLRAPARRVALMVRPETLRSVRQRRGRTGAAQRAGRRACRDVILVGGVTKTYVRLADGQRSSPPRAHRVTPRPSATPGARRRA